MLGLRNYWDSRHKTTFRFGIGLAKYRRDNRLGQAVKAITFTNWFSGQNGRFTTLIPQKVSEIEPKFVKIFVGLVTKSR